MAPFKMAPKPLTRPTTWLHPLSVPPLRAASHPGTVAQRGPLLGNLARCWALAQGSAGCHVPQEALLDCSTHRGRPDILFQRPNVQRLELFAIYHQFGRVYLLIFAYLPLYCHRKQSGGHMGAR